MNYKGETNSTLVNTYLLLLALITCNFLSHKKYFT